jgi:uncharacterized protein YodC (DUF2158 family)
MHDDDSLMNLHPALLVRPGDLVRLKSGGPWMTVNSVCLEDQTVECYWFDPDEAFYAVIFAMAGLSQAPE